MQVITVVGLVGFVVSKTGLAPFDVMDKGAHRLGMDLHVMLRNACCWCFGHFILFFTYLLPIIPA
ncbi:hypothetical protein TELCIR_20380, partial [Teladorsagia circumcincta]